jgi:hypothetical protein
MLQSSQVMPFALSLSKGGLGFAKLSPNGVANG